MSKQKKALFNSALSLLLCFSMLLGTTWAWFTDSVTSTNNIIKSGKLDVEMSWSDTKDGTFKDASTGAIFDYEYWEPGFTQIKYVKIDNVGNLAFRYVLNIIPNTMPAAGEVNLADVIDVYLVDTSKGDITRETLAGLTPVGTLSALMADSNGAARGVMLPVEGATNVTLNESDKTIAQTGTATYCIALKMQESAGNEYQDKTVGGGFAVQLLATQYTYENDTFGNDFDTDSEWPGLGLESSATGTATVTVTDGKVDTAATISTNTEITATVPKDVAVDSNTLTLTVSEKETTDSGLTTGTNEELMALDVHIDGVSEGNETAIIIALGKVLPVGMNMGNVALYHVEDGKTNVMTQVETLADLDEHNEFYYDPATGELTVAMATFSEIALLADNTKAWEGNVAKGFSSGSGTEADPYIIANADQLAYLGDRVSNDNDNYGGKHYKLISDVNFGGDKVLDENRKLKFYPIGYTSEGYEGAFMGTFDGAGHTISNIYQNTWLLLGTYDGTYYNAAMGLFGYVYGGTVKNLTVDNFKSEGEFAPTGCVAAYAANATFENIAITNSHPQTYNTSVAAVVGRDGKNGLNENDGYNLIFKNITVDSSNTVSALWGSWDVGAAGLLGYLGSDSKVLFENCNEAATIDVYNDVCGNYQYYWYRYCGAYIGTVNKRLDNGKGALDLSNVTAKNCTVDFGYRHEYYYCEFEKNSIASYTEDYQFSRVDHSELNMDANPVTCKHTHTANEDKQAVYIPFRQLFGGYGWGVDGVDEYENIEIKTLTNVDKFEKNDALSGDFLYRVGNGNAFPVGKLFQEISENIAVDSGVYVSVKSLVEGVNMVGTFVKNESDWTQSKLHITGGTGPAKLTIQDYNNCTPFELIVEVVDATNITSATGTTTGGDMVLLCNVNSTSYVNYWNCTLYGNGFTYSLKGAPTAYNSKQGHGILITKNATLDNLVIVGDVYDEYGAYTNNNDYNAAIDVMGDTVIQNCYISGCSAPVSTRANATITNTTLYGGAVANLLIKGGTVTLENVTTANYNDGRYDEEKSIGMGIVVHSDAAESAKLVLNGTLTQYNFLNEEDTPTDTYAEKLHSAMFGSSLSQYHFGTSPNRRVNTGIISLSATFNGEDITDNANTGYSGSSVTLSGVDGYVYTQLNTSGSVDNSYTKEDYSSTTQGPVPPTISFDHTINEVAKTNDSNDYCYEDGGTVHISMDEGDTFNWDTSILNVTKVGETLGYTVSINGTDYTGKSIAFNSAGSYEVVYSYTDPNNFGYDADGNITTYEKTYTKTITINVSVIKPTTKHAEFTFGSSNQAVEQITVDNKTYLSATNKTANGTYWGCMTVGTSKIYYPIVEAEIVQTKESSIISTNAEVQAYFYVFDGTITITDYENGGAGNSVTYNSSTTTMPSGLTVVKGKYGNVSDNTTWYSSYNDTSLSLTGAENVFKYAGSNAVSSSPTTRSNKLCYASDSGLSTKNRSEYYTLVQYQYTDNAGAIYYYYVGYHMRDSKEVAPDSGTCIAEGTMITLADGSKKAVEDLRKGDVVMAFDHVTGEIVYRDVLIVGKTYADSYYKNTFIFDDGTSLVTINEHGIYDLDLNQYINIGHQNYREYVGHRFVSVDSSGDIGVKRLVDVATVCESGYKYDIVTNGTFNYVAEDTLSVTHEVVDIVNSFAFGDDMLYDAEAMKADIEKYGLYTYEDFAEYCDRSVFEQYNMAMMKIGASKGYYTKEHIVYLLTEIALNEDVQIID